MDIEKNIEYIGYGVLSKIARNTYIAINNFASKFLRLADKIKFEQYKMKFGERDDDIYIASYPKSGTTMMQMILYQLTTKGKMDFNHIYDVSPWIRNASFRNQSPPELPSPRIIKTHDYHNQFRKKTKGKFIYVYRNGMDVAVSLYHQNKNYNNSDLTLDTYLKRFLKNKLWFKHTKGWFKNKNKLPVLYVKYEDLLNDKRAEIDRLIEFTKLDVNADAIDKAIKYSSFDFMKKNEKKFGNQPRERKKVYDQFIRKGKIGEGEKSFNQEQKVNFNKSFNKIVKPFHDKVFCMDD